MQFQKVQLFVPRLPNFANVIIFLAKNSKKKSPSTQSNGMRAVLETFSHVFGSCKIKGYTINENVSFRDHTSRIRFPDCSKFAINRRNDNDVKVYRNDLIVNFFYHFRVSLVKFSYQSKFHVNIVTGSRVMTTFVCK